MSHCFTAHGTALCTADSTTLCAKHGATFSVTHSTAFNITALVHLALLAKFYLQCRKGQFCTTTTKVWIVQNSNMLPHIACVLSQDDFAVTHGFSGCGNTWVFVQYCIHFHVVLHIFFAAPHQGFWYSTTCDIKGCSTVWGIFSNWPVPNSISYIFIVREDAY